MSMQGAKNTEIFVGLIIQTEKTGDTSVRVKILTQDGLKSFTATGAQKATAKLKGALQMFTLAEFSIIGHKIVGAHVINAHQNIVADIKRYFLACTICEVIAKLQHADVFNLTLAGFDMLSSPDLSTREIFAQYFTELIKILGYDIEPDQDINSAFLYHLDIKIPNTKYFL